MFLATLIVLSLCDPPSTAPALPNGAAVQAAVEKPIAEAVPSFALFRPSTHGFAFTNSFRGSPLPISLGKFESRLNIPDRFGLCGGMSFAAADFYLAGRNLRDEIPATDPPAHGTPLYNYLYARQVASLAPLAVMATKFLEWMDLPENGDDGTHARTLAELDAILSQSAAGKPILLGLVLADGAATREVWRNHQVLLYAVDTTDDAPPTLRIYDPNFPDRDDVVIVWIDDDKDPRWERHVPDARRRDITRVRGFFQMPYEPVEPPRFPD